MFILPEFKFGTSLASGALSLFLYELLVRTNHRVPRTRCNFNPRRRNGVSSRLCKGRLPIRTRVLDCEGRGKIAPAKRERARGRD